MAGRYVVREDWVRVTLTPILDDYSEDYYGATLALVSVATATLEDTRTGMSYDQGAYRVKIHTTSKYRGAKPRNKIFKGETAWNDAERYAEDAIRMIKRNASDAVNVRQGGAV